MPFKSEKQRRWMYANKPEMAKRWSAEYKNKGGMTEDGIATHYRNGKKKSQGQIDYERRVMKSNAKIKEQLAPLGAAAAGFVPGVGEAMDAKDAYDAWSAGDYATAAGIAGLGAIGLVPGVGDAIAGGARAARRAAPLAGTAIRHMDKDYADLALRELRGDPGPLPQSAGASAFYGMNEKEALDYLSKFENKVPKDQYRRAQAAITKSRNPAALRSEKKKAQLPELLGPEWKNIVEDIELEKHLPSAGRNYQFGSSKVVPANIAGRNPETHYRPYETPEGDFVHGLFLGPNRDFSSVMGGKELNFPEANYAKTVGGVKRPSPKKNFAVLGEDIANNTVQGQLAKMGVNSPEDLIVGRGPLGKK